MQTHIRTFIAIKIKPDQELLNRLEYFKKVFANERISWVGEDNFHLTLRFVGNTNRDQLYELVDSLKMVAKETNYFHLSIEGCGYFKSKGQPRILYLRIADSDTLHELAANIEKKVAKVGFHNELKPFRPHLTIGIIRHLENITRFYSILDEWKEVDYQKRAVSEFVLYQSILQNEGPIYKVIKTFKLK